MKRPTVIILILISVITFISAIQLGLLAWQMWQEERMPVVGVAV